MRVSFPAAKSNRKKVDAIPTIDEIRAAASRIKPFIHRTPVLTCQSINLTCRGEVFFKCENFQKVGAFKARGAMNAVFSFDREEIQRGVATHSSGNHGAALAYAARCRGIKAYVVMPENASLVKRAAVAGYGAEVVLCEPNQKARENTLAEVVTSTGCMFIHPYNDYRVICGQATAALEFCEQTPSLDTIIAPVGGGGLLSGTALTVSSIQPGTRILAAEPEGADDAYRSLQAGVIIAVESPRTIADGLRTSLGTRTFPIIREYVQDIITVSEEAIVDAMRYLWERMKIIVEPSAAVGFAALFTKRDRIPGSRIGILLSGGNVDLDHLPWAEQAVRTSTKCE